MIVEPLVFKFITESFKIQVIIARARYGGNSSAEHNNMQDKETTETHRSSGISASWKKNIMFREAQHCPDWGINEDLLLTKGQSRSLKNMACVMVT